jgi:hypothetical protein
MPLADRFREVFAYNEEIGYLMRIIPTAPMHKVAERVGYRHSKGYLSLKLDYKSYQVHRVIWAIVHGKMPAGEIDHINGDKQDNRLCNLRDISKQMNQMNRPHGPSRNNTSGHTGVFPRSNGTYVALIGGAKHRRHLGVFKSLDDAVAAHQAACAQMWEAA